nr:uncharacterized protein LOC125182909 [Anser cygnoides]
MVLSNISVCALILHAFLPTPINFRSYTPDAAWKGSLASLRSVPRNLSQKLIQAKPSPLKSGSCLALSFPGSVSLCLLWPCSIFSSHSCFDYTKESQKEQRTYPSLLLPREVVPGVCQSTARCLCYETEVRVSAQLPQHSCTPVLSWPRCSPGPGGHGQLLAPSRPGSPLPLSRTGRKRDGGAGQDKGWEITYKLPSEAKRTRGTLIYCQLKTKPKQQQKHISSNPSSSQAQLHAFPPDPPASPCPGRAGPGAVPAPPCRSLPCSPVGLLGLQGNLCARSPSCPPPALPPLTSVSPWHNGGTEGLRCALRGLERAGTGTGQPRPLLTQAPPRALRPRAHRRTSTVLHF